MGTAMTKIKKGQNRDADRVVDVIHYKPSANPRGSEITQSTLSVKVSGSSSKDILNSSLNSSLIPSNSASVSKLKNRTTLRNNTSDKHLNSKQNHKLLAFGWVRHQFQETLSTKTGYVPLRILDLCFEYMFMERILFCFIASEDEKISSIQAVDVSNIYKVQYKTSEMINIGYDTNGICIYSSNIRFPPSIHVQHTTLDMQRASYHTIFKVGSEESCAAKALVIPKEQFAPSRITHSYSSKYEIMSSFEIDLPHLPISNARFGNAVCFSAKHGLISIGGQHPDTGAFLGSGSYSGVLQLNWKGFATMDDCKWKNLRRMNTGCVHIFIKNNYFYKYLG